MSTCEGFDHPIDPAQWMHLQFQLFFVPTSGLQLTGPSKELVCVAVSGGK